MVVRSELTTLDGVVFSSVLVATFVAVRVGTLRKATGKEDSILDYLVMGRKLTLPLFVATLVSTWYGGIFGVTQLTYERGIYNFVTQGVFWYAAYIVFALFLVDKIKGYQAVTLPDLVNKMVGPRSARFVAVLSFINVVPISYTIGLGIFLQLVLGLTPLMGQVYGVSFVLLYSSFGGLRSVVLSDMVQFSVMVLAVLLVVLFSFFEFGGTSFLVSNIPSEHWSITGGEDWMGLGMWGLIAASTLVDPNFYQRCFAAKTPAIAKRGILISTLVWLAFDCCTTLGGLYARAAFADVASSHAYFELVLRVLPSGLLGFALAGILATILSTLDSYMFLASATLVHDVIGVRSGRVAYALASMLVGGLSLALASWFGQNVVSVWKLVGGLSTAACLVPLLWCYRFKVVESQFLTSSILATITVLVWEIGDFSSIPSLYPGCLVALLTLFCLRPKKV